MSETEAQILTHPPPAALKPLAVDCDRRRILFELHPRAQTLMDIKPDASTWAPLLRRLSPLVAETHQLPAAVSTQADLAWPTFSPVAWADYLTFTPAAKELVKLVQARPLLCEAVDRFSDMPATSLIHGDIKPDNVLIIDDEVYLIDWELAGVGDPLIDVGGLVGMLLTTVIDVPGESDATEIAPMRAPESAQLAEAIGTILRGYTTHGGTIDYADAMRACAAWLVGRAWTMAMHERALGYQARILLLIAHRTLRAVGG